MGPRSSSSFSFSFQVFTGAWLIPLWALFAVDSWLAAFKLAVQFEEGLCIGGTQDFGCFRRRLVFFYFLFLA